MEQTLDVEAYSLVIPPLIAKSTELEEPEATEGMKFLKNLDDQQINTLANLVLASGKLPENQLVNIINEMKSYRLFYNRCLDDSINIVQTYYGVRTKSNNYISPVQFVLRSKKTGIETESNADMEVLLQSWGL
jgi:hypothetical protein